VSLPRSPSPGRVGGPAGGVWLTAPAPCPTTGPSPRRGPWPPGSGPRWPRWGPTGGPGEPRHGTPQTSHPPLPWAPGGRPTISMSLCRWSPPSMTGPSRPRWTSLRPLPRLGVLGDATASRVRCPHLTRHRVSLGPQ